MRKKSELEEVLEKEAIHSGLQKSIRNAISDTVRVHVDPVLGQSIDRRINARDEAIAKATHDIYTMLIEEASQFSDVYKFRSHLFDLRRDHYTAARARKARNEIAIAEHVERSLEFRRHANHAGVAEPEPEVKIMSRWDRAMNYIGDAIYGKR